MEWPWNKSNKNELPQFWKEYLATFKESKDPLLSRTRIVVYDTETTGFDIKNDRILSIGAIAITSGVIDLSDSFEIYIEQEIFNEETVKIHGILKEGNYQKVAEEEAIERFIRYLGNAPLIAHHAVFDQRMINQALNRMGLEKLKNVIYDTGLLYKKTKHFISESIPEQSYTLDAIAKELNISMEDRHTAAGDAFITALVFLKTVTKLDPDKKLTVKRLNRSSLF
ncbi:3'-5' exonuclease [Spongiivirga citrea]|uniref:3'-5' exonuclease n=1 Tax=Spongiivirga citrea TaxID=1481457 RepID=A0A6M0CPM6_9FLAO|nr:3'-5' exonuclease [Spongiivirga citrea]NER17437.1 3'-5' exonuclease [Spongiivirga citrea]